MENQESIYEEKQGNLLTGILGALLGALIGTALWVLVGALGAYPIVLGDRRKKQRQDTVQPYEAADGAPKSTENADDTDNHLDA